MNKPVGIRIEDFIKVSESLAMIRYELNEILNCDDLNKKEKDIFKLKEMVSGLIDSPVRMINEDQMLVKDADNELKEYEVIAPVIFKASLSIEANSKEEAKKELLSILKQNENSILEICDKDYDIDEGSIECVEC